ncbi:hypothetical protein Droror1_Dr00002387 [Drosera rotundifolia]
MGTAAEAGAERRSRRMKRKGEGEAQCLKLERRELEEDMHSNGDISVSFNGQKKDDSNLISEVPTVLIAFVG